MKSLKRSAVIITPKRPFMAWANSCSAEGDFTKEYYQEHWRVIVIIPACFFIEEARKHVNAVWAELFAERLASWNTDKTLWPEVMDKKMFWQWFDMELVWDVVDGERE
jgi:hypothetical protein